MTFWAKILTVIILVLSVLFAAMSTILFVKKDEWRLAYETQRMNYQGQVDQLAARVNSTQSALDITSSERDKLRLDFASLTAERDGMKTEVARLNSAMQEKSGTINTLNANLAALTETVQREAQRFAQIEQEKDSLDKNLRSFMVKLDESTKENQRLTTENVALKDDLQNTSEKLTTVTDALTRTDRLVAHLRKVFPQMSPYIDEGVPMPKIDGRVLAVDEASGIAIINRGAKAGVKMDFKFTVYRGAELKGTVRVFEVNGEDLCAAKIEFMAKDSQGKPKSIEIGDNVTTAIGY